MNISKLDSWLVIIGSIVVALPGLIFLSDTVWIVSHTAKIPGQVIAVERGQDWRYKPVFTFTDATGVLHTQHSEYTTYDFAFEPGEKVRVLYDAADPETARIDSFETVWESPLIVAAVCLLIGGSFWVLQWLTAIGANANYCKLSLGIGFGGLLVLVGLIWFSHKVWFISHAAKAQGQILAMEQISWGSGARGGGNKPVRPEYTFTDASGIIHTQWNSAASSIYSFKRGDKVEVLYDMAAPKHSVIGSFLTLWLGPMVLGGFGLLFGGLFSAIAWIRRFRH